MTDRSNYHCRAWDRSRVTTWVRLVQLLISVVLLAVTLWSLGCTP